MLEQFLQVFDLHNRCYIRHENPSWGKIVNEQCEYFLQRCVFAFTGCQLYFTGSTNNENNSVYTLEKWES